MPWLLLLLAASVAPDPLSEPPPQGDEDTDETADVGESREPTPGVDAQFRYTAEWSDEALAQAWTRTPDALGSIAFGFADEGRLMNARQFPPDDAWILVSPETAWATSETIDFVVAAIRRVKDQFPDAPALRVNALSAPEGGYLRPHKSHQNGRDVDLGFYYPTSEPVRRPDRERYLDVSRTWALLRALVTDTDVQVVFCDRRVQKVLHAYASAIGEDREWLDSIFHAGAASIVRHARRHRDHFHVRFYSPRAQELGRRVAPLLALRPEQNLAMYRVRKGDTLGAIALKFGTTVSLIQKANRMKGTFLRLSRVLKVPLRKPCTSCPLPPPVAVPSRRLPPRA